MIYFAAPDPSARRNVPVDEVKRESHLHLVLMVRALV
jgi:hypothetical protein